MIFLILAVLAGIAWHQHTRGTPDHFVRLQGSGTEVWVFDIRELWVELRSSGDTVDAKQRYELRRAGPEQWEMRLTSTHPARRNLFFPGPSLRAVEAELDDAADEQAWLRCGTPAEEMLERAYRRYNRLDEAG